MKIHLELVTEAVEGLFDDELSLYPELSKCIEKQRKFTLTLLSQHGLAFATLALPQAGKWFDHCLAEGYINSDRPLFHGHRKDSIYPKYLWYLWAGVFSEDGVIRDNPDVNAIVSLRQHYFLAKKLTIDCDRDRVYEAVESFIDVDSRLTPPRPGSWYVDNPKWKSCEGHPLYGVDTVNHTVSQLESYPGGENQSLPWHLLRLLSRAVVGSWGELDIWSLRPKHGPGAVADKNMLKYEFETWPTRLASVFPPDWFASHDLVDRTQSCREIGSKLCAVPKTQKGPRLIASEPVAHQWMQGALWRWLEDRVGSSPLGLSIDFRNQVKSQVKALTASKTGEYATIDLSEASDRVSLRLVEYIFQGNPLLLDALHACRTRWVEIPGSLTRKGKDEFVYLKKFSTMGSAVTFPIQTIVFTILGHFALMISRGERDVSLEGMRQRANALRVFGDDIIIASDAYEVMTRILSECGLKVNGSKSFWKGSFREACGMDAFGGVDVTPAYLRQPYSPSQPESLKSLIEVSNNFHKKGFWRTAERLLKTVPGDRKSVV